MVRTVFQIELSNISCAPNGHPMNINGSHLRPYMTINFADDYKKFKTEPKGQNEGFEWSNFVEHFEFATNYAHRLDAKNIVFEVYSKNSLLSDDLIGTASIDLHTVATGARSNKLDLKNQGGAWSGFVQFDLSMSQSCESVQARLLNLVAATNLEGAPSAVYSLNYQCTLSKASPLVTDVVPAQSSSPLRAQFSPSQELQFSALSVEDLERANIMLRLRSHAAVGLTDVGVVTVPLSKYYAAGQVPIAFSEPITAGPAVVGTLTGQLLVIDGPAFAQMVGGLNTTASVQPGAMRFQGMPVPSRMAGPVAQAPIDRVAAPPPPPAAPLGSGAPRSVVISPAAPAPAPAPAPAAAAALPPTIGSNLHLPPAIGASAAGVAKPASVNLSAPGAAVSVVPPPQVLPAPTIVNGQAVAIPVQPTYSAGGGYATPVVAAGYPAAAVAAGGYPGAVYAQQPVQGYGTPVVGYGTPVAGYPQMQVAYPQQPVAPVAPVVQQPQLIMAQPAPNMVPTVNVDPVPHNNLLVPEDVEPFPHDWTCAVDQAGRYYFKYAPTRQTSWQDPRFLPAGWEQRVDQQGKLYFAHSQTRNTSWFDPRGLPDGWAGNMVAGNPNPVYTDLKVNISTPLDPRGLPKGFTQHITAYDGSAAGGRIYFRNHNTKTTQWDDPRVSMRPEQLKQLRTEERQRWEKAKVPVDPFQEQLKELDQELISRVAALTLDGQQGTEAASRRQATELAEWEKEFRANIATEKKARELALKAKLATLHSDSQAKRQAVKQVFESRKQAAEVVHNQDKAARDASDAQARAQLKAETDALLASVQHPQPAPAALPAVVAPVAQQQPVYMYGGQPAPAVVVPGGYPGQQQQVVYLAQAPGAAQYPGAVALAPAPAPAAHLPPVIGQSAAAPAAKPNLPPVIGQPY